jgi:hypothetical protein
MGFTIGIRIELQAEMGGAADDSLSSGDGLAVDDADQLEELGDFLASDVFGGRPLHANEVDFAALDGKPGLTVKKGSARHLLEELEPEAKGARHGPPSRRGIWVCDSRLRVFDSDGMHVVAYKNGGRAVFDREPSLAVVLGYFELHGDANAKFRLVDERENDLAGSATSFAPDPGTARVGVFVIGVDRIVGAAIERISGRPLAACKFPAIDAILAKKTIPRMHRLNRRRG